PRGLASLVFALLALEELGPGADHAVAAIAVTVLLSVVAHGASAAPLAARYGASAAREAEPDAPDVPVRGLPGRRAPEPPSDDGSGDTER
ncbi:MAG TPA: sodium:proton antiporter, partial [Actinomycetota bacterium]